MNSKKIPVKLSVFLFFGKGTADRNSVGFQKICYNYSLKVYILEVYEHGCTGNPY